MWTKAISLGQWHSRPDTISARFIGRRGNHAASFGPATDYHWLASQFWSKYLLHGNKKGVQIDVQNMADHGSTMIIG